MIKLLLRLFAFFWCIISISYILNKKTVKLATFTSDTVPNLQSQGHQVIRDPSMFLSLPSSSSIPKYSLQVAPSEDDSLERMYDKNYMDYDYHEYNPHDDDEWHGYYND